MWVVAPRGLGKYHGEADVNGRTVIMYRKGGGGRGLCDYCFKASNLGHSDILS